MATYYPQDDREEHSLLLQEIERLKGRIAELERGRVGKTTNPLIYSGKMFPRKAVFIDRDGTVIDAVHRPDFHKIITAPFAESEVRFVQHVYADLQRLKELGYLRIMVTNQPDVLHGYMEEEVWRRIQKRVADTLGFDDVYMCRHREEDNCIFKKPSPYMLWSAADKWGIDLSRSFMVGDTDADMLSGEMAGCTTILIDKFYNRGHISDFRVPTFREAVDLVDELNTKWLIDKSPA